MNFKKNSATDFKDLDAMDKNEARREIKALQEGIEHHDYRYDGRNQLVISDTV
jgi:NAD-dependent DNA ligase